MQNLEQIRAKNALDAISGIKEGGRDGGDVLSGFPALIINNGLLATIAFSMKQGGGYAQTCGAIARHLQSIGLIPENVGLITYLSNGNSTQLRLCTAEALAYLAYLKRFGKKE